MSPDDPCVRKDPRLVAQMLWSAMLASVGMYYAVLLVLVHAGVMSGDPSRAEPLRAALLPAATALMFVVVRVYRRRLAPDAPPAEAWETLALYVLCWTLSEAIALAGFVIGVLGHELEASALFYLWAVCLLGALRPRRERFLVSVA